jgi:hypothetical protein
MPLSDDQRIDRLETRIDRLEAKMDNGFAAMRSEHRSDYRTLLGIQLTMFFAMILGFAGIILQQSLS